LGFASKKKKLFENQACKWWKRQPQNVEKINLYMTGQKTIQHEPNGKRKLYPIVFYISACLAPEVLLIAECLLMLSLVNGRQGDNLSS
jgi:hypothetical protein